MAPHDFDKTLFCTVYWGLDIKIITDTDHALVFVFDFFFCCFVFCFCHKNVHFSSKVWSVLIFWTVSAWKCSYVCSYILLKEI